MAEPPRMKRPSAADLARQTRELQGEPPPAQKLGLGKVPVPPKTPPRPELRSSPVHEETRQGVAPPAPGSAPQPRHQGSPGSVESTYKNFPPPPVPYGQGRSYSPPPMASPEEEAAIEREAVSHGERVVRRPERSYSPPPSSVTREDFRADRRGITVTWGTVRKILWWATPVLLTLVGTVTGYFQGLKMAGERMAAAEERIRLNGEADKRRDVRIDSHDADLDRAFVMLRDHDSRLPKLKVEIEEVRGGQPRIEGLPKKK